MLKRIDHHLLLHNPFWWVAKPHYVTAWVLVFSAAFLLLFLSTDMTASPISSDGKFSNIDILFITIALLTLGALWMWTRYQNTYNENKVHDKRKGKSAIVKFLIYTYCTGLIMGSGLLLFVIMWDQIPNKAYNDYSMEFRSLIREVSDPNRVFFQSIVALSLLYPILLLTYRKTSLKLFIIAIITMIALGFLVALIVSEFLPSDDVSWNSTILFLYVLILFRVARVRSDRRFLKSNAISIIILTIATPILIWVYTMEYATKWFSVTDSDEKVYFATACAWFAQLFLIPFTERKFSKLNSSPQ